MTLFSDVMNEIIWNNRFMCIDEKSVYRSDLVNLGIIKLGDLITDNNLFLHDDPYVTISPEKRFFYGSCSIFSMGLKNNY